MAREGPTLAQPAVDEIAQAVARELTRRQQNDPGVVPRERRTTSIKAYELFLRGSDPAVMRSDSAARAGLRHFQEAVALDSHYAAAWAGLARMTNRVGGHRSLALTEAAASRAIVLDTTYAEAWAILGAHRTRARDFLTAERHFQRAIALEPNSGRIREIRANSLLVAGQPIEAQAEAERAVALGPLAPSALAVLAHALLLNDRCDEALARLEPLMALEPPPLRVAGLAAACHARKANWAGAIAVLERQAEREATTRAMLGYMRARAGQRNQATEIQDGLLQLWRNGHLPAVWLAWVPAGLGQRDSAFAWIDRAFADSSIFYEVGTHGLGGGTPSFRLHEPLFDNLRGDPRFETVVKRLGDQNR
jgi:Flp pilus assembly protein TadD